MQLRIERDGLVLFDADVDSIEYAEKTDGTVSVVGRPAQPERAAGSGIADALKALGEKAAQRQREQNIEHGRMLREADIAPANAENGSRPGDRAIEQGQ